jgi:hypothetical protein
VTQSQRPSSAPKAKDQTPSRPASAPKVEATAVTPARAMTPVKTAPLVVDDTARLSKADRLRANAAAARGEEDAAIDSRENSASSRATTDSADSADSAVVHERPASRGGRAFDLSFEGSVSSTPTRLPARLEKLQLRSKTEELSVEQLKAKLEGADQRRKAYETALKAKMAQETSKVQQVQQTHVALKDEEASRQSEVVEKENKALLNRSASLKALRDKLKAREEHAQKVREAKRLNSSAGLSMACRIVEN